MAVTENYLRAIAALGLASDSAGAARCRERFKLERRSLDALQTEAHGLQTVINATDGLRLRLQALQAQREDVEDRGGVTDAAAMPLYTGNAEILKVNLPENTVSARAYKTRQLAHLDAQIAAVKEEIVDHTGRQEFLAAQISPLVVRQRRCELVLNSKTVLSFAPPLDIKKGAGVREVEVEQTKIQNLKADRREVEALPVAAAVRRAKAEASLTEFSARPRVDETGRWVFPKSVDTLSWVLRELKLHEKIYAADIEPDAKTGAVTDAERARRIKQIDAEILLANRREEALVGALLEAGDNQVVSRRDSDCRAILGLADDCLIPRDASVGMAV